MKQMIAIHVVKISIWQHTCSKSELEILKIYFDNSIIVYESFTNTEKHPWQMLFIVVSYCNQNTIVQRLPHHK